MPYDPTPTGDDYFASIQFDERGNPFQLSASGKRVYIPPAAAATADPTHPVGAKLAAWAQSKGASYADPGGGNAPGGFWKGRETWNGEEGKMDSPVNWGNIASLAIGGAIGAPLAAGALAGAGGGSAAAGGATTAGVGGGTTAAAGGSTALTGGLAGAAKGYFSNPKNWLEIAGGVGDLFTANAAGRAQGREQEAGIGQNQDRNAISLYNSLLANNAAQNNFGLNRGALANSNATTDLNQRQFKLSAPGQRAGNAVRGDILSRAQDVSVSGLSPNIPVPTISGGLRPSMFSPNTRALGENMTAQARREQEAGDTFAPLPELPTWQDAPKPPTLTGLPQATGTDDFLTTGGNILNTAGALGGTFMDYYNRYKQKPLPKVAAGPAAIDEGWYA